MKRSKSKHSKTYRKNRLSILVFIICFATMIFSSVHIIKWLKENNKNKNTMSRITNSVTVENEELLVDFEKLKEENENTVAWLKVEGTNIEYPVVKGSNNSFYLDHGFDNSYNSAGWIFADYTNKFDGTDKHIVIYGHNRRDGSMFGSLKKVLEEEWCNNQDNRILTLVTEKGNIKYEVFSVYKIENEDYYITTRFDNNEEFEEFINTLKSRSKYNFNTEVQKTDKVLTLSTCADNNKYRVVLHARKLVEELVEEEE